MADNLNVYHMIDGDPSLYEVARSNNFELVVEGLGGLMRAGVRLPEEQATGDDRTGSGADESIRLSVISTSVPHFTQDEVVIQRGNTKMYAAGTPTFGEGTLSVHDFIGLNGASVLSAWQRLSFNVVSGAVGRMADYKKSAILIQYSPDLVPVRKWQLDGCWVKGLSEPEFSAEDQSKRAVTATIRYDRAYPIYD